MKRKKKINTQQNKQQSRQHQNEFFKKMRHFMELLGNKEAFGMLDKKGLYLLYASRFRPFKIIADKTKPNQIKKKALEDLNIELSYLLHNTFTNVGEKQIEISLYDFSVYVETLHLLWENADLQSEDFAAKFRPCFPIFNEDFLSIKQNVLDNIIFRLDYLAYIQSDSFENILFFISEKCIDSKASVFCNNYVIQDLELETEVLNIDGHNRTIYKVHYIEASRFLPLKLKPEKLGIDGILKDLPLQVYIQKHVLERMEERLDRFYSMCNFGFIVAALLSNKILPAGKKYSFLFPLEDKKIKLGYFKGEIIGDKIIIRTFLFLTNNGTPEGKKLQTLIGLQKEDKKYLGIDKLSTFINSDIKKDEKLVELFRQAGCGDLFNLNINMLDPKANKEIAISQYLSQYIGLKNTPAEEPVCEETLQF